MSCCYDVQLNFIHYKFTTTECFKNSTPLVCYIYVSSISCIIFRFGIWVLQISIFDFWRILRCRPRVFHGWIPWEFPEVQKGCPKEYAAKQGEKFINKMKFRPCYETIGGMQHRISPCKEYEDKHKLKIHLQEVSSVPSYPKPVEDDRLQFPPKYNITDFTLK